MFLNYQIVALPALQDNYVWLIHDEINAIVVDPGCATVVNTYLKQHQLNLQLVLITHKHNDHIGGVAELVQKYAPLVIAKQSHSNMQYLQQLKPWLDKLTILNIPGHTDDHLAYLWDKQHLFCGDTLFGLGCGRVFTQDYLAMYTSLQTIAHLPPSTLCYPAHEYTLRNGQFISQFDPNSAFYQNYLEHLTSKLVMRSNSLPVLLADELIYNPFLRCVTQANFVDYLAGLTQQSFIDGLDAFIYLRQLRNQF
jgi:hydroxyacylglutathione hydrolase